MFMLNEKQNTQTYKNQQSKSNSIQLAIINSGWNYNNESLQLSGARYFKSINAIEKYLLVSKKAFLEFYYCNPLIN